MTTHHKDMHEYAGCGVAQRDICHPGQRWQHSTGGGYVSGRGLHVVLGTTHRRQVYNARHGRPPSPPAGAAHDRANHLHTANSLR